MKDEIVNESRDSLLAMIPGAITYHGFLRFNKESLFGFGVDLLTTSLNAISAFGLIYGPNFEPSPLEPVGKVLCISGALLGIALRQKFYRELKYEYY